MNIIRPHGYGYTNKKRNRFSGLSRLAYALATVIFGASAIFAADFFPTDLNRTWVFDYEYRTGHSGGGTNFFGLKHWQIIQTDTLDNGEINFTVLEKTELTRKKFEAARSFIFNETIGESKR